MDWMRYMRAVSARNVESMEKRHDDFLAKKIGADAFDREDQDAIVEHNRLFREYFENDNA